MKYDLLALAVLLSFTSSLSGCSKKSDTCGTPLEESALFLAGTTTSLSADLEAARTAALAAESAHAQEALFAEKIAVIAKDPVASEQWATLLKGKGADARSISKASGVAVDMPMQANRLRAAGVPADEVTKLIDATRVEFTLDETSALLAASASASEEQGAIEGLGTWTSEQVKLGLRGAGLEKELRAEHRIRGQKVRKADEASPKKSTVCHRPPGNPNNAKTHEVGPSALAAHLAHGDSEGPCPADIGKPGAESPQERKGAESGKANGKGPGKPKK